MKSAAEPATIDAARLQANFAEVATHGDEVALFFYSHLFIAHPTTRTLFPTNMNKQRDRLVGALGRAVSQVDRLDELVPFLQQLGRDHRKFGAVAEHYPAVGASLIATLAHFSGPSWTAQLEQDWTQAYELVARTMIDAAEAAATVEPDAWTAEVIAHERRSFDVAVIRVRPDQPLLYQPGQSLSVETDLQRRLWRYYSPANAPRDDGTIDLHVQLVPGGQVSAALVRHLAVGDRLRLGSPVGHHLALDDRADRDLALVAGGTGLAPLKALIDQLAIAGHPRRAVELYHGARNFSGLYDRVELDHLAAKHPWLTVTYALSGEELYPDIESGQIGVVAARAGRLIDRDVLVCGSPQMVEHTVLVLVQGGVPADRIRFDEFTPR